MRRRAVFDVTDTLLSGSRTGIQRVTIEVARLLLLVPDVTLVRFHHWRGLFLPLTEHEMHILLSPSESRQPERSRRLGRARFIAVRRFIAWLVDAIRRPLHSFNTLSEPWEGAYYLTAEIVGDRGRARKLGAWRQSGKLKLAYILHDLFPLTHPSETRLHQSDFLRYLSLVKDATVFPISNATADELHKHKISEAVHPLRLGIRIPTWNIEPRSRTPLFLYVGTIERRKNQLPLLGVLTELWNKGREFAFVFAGAATAESGEFAIQIADLQREGRAVTWLNSANDADLETLFRTAWASVYVSNREGFGLPVLESVARGTPCIVSDASALREAAEWFGGCRVVSVQDQTEWAAALEELIESPELIGEWQESIRRDRFVSWEEYVRQLLSVLEGS